MASLKKIGEEIEGFNVLKTVVESYETIAASSMQKVRNYILKNREFMDGVNRIFQEVMKINHKKLQDLRKKEALRRKFTKFFAKPVKKDAYILISANTGLYGPIINKTFSFFTDEIRRKNRMK